MANVLIVDDQKSVLLTLEALLKSEKHLVTSCTNAIDAMDRLLHEHFDMVITDAIMPMGGNGYALIRTIRNHPLISKIPVIMLTGKREKADVEKGIEAGADDYVVKPIDPSLLIAKINEALTKRSPKQFVEASCLVKADWETKTEIVGISEMGLTLTSNVGLSIGALLRLGSSVFDEVGIAKPMLRIVACEEVKNQENSYRIKANFVGISEKELTPLRLWIRSKKSF